MRRRATRRRRRRRQRGGTRTASGANGCVFIPSLLGDETKVSKVFVSKFSFENEVAALDLINEYIDPLHEFTVNGIPDRLDISSELIRLCRENSFAFNSEGKYYVIHYDYAGVPLNEIEDLTDSRYLKAFITLFRHVCYMNLRGYIHGDIGKPNITYKEGKDGKDSKFYLIDYEFVEQAENYKHDVIDMLKILKEDFGIHYPGLIGNISKLEYSMFVGKIIEFLDTI